jgi:dihydrofolate reductase
MGKLIVTEWMSLDGVVQAPSLPDEDTSGGFAHGGWHLPYFDDVSRGWVEKNLARAGGFLLGRRTYETFAAYWPKASEEEKSVSQPLNTQPKCVASTTLTGPLAWQHSTVVTGDLGKAISELKQQDGGDLLVIGSAGLVPALVDLGLVDEFRLMIDPVILGGGKRFLRDDGVLRQLRLVDSQVTTTGAILATYARADA